MTVTFLALAENDSLLSQVQLSPAPPLAMISLAMSGTPYSLKYTTSPTAGAVMVAKADGCLQAYQSVPPW